jgi:hypothetical protein
MRHELRPPPKFYEPRNILEPTQSVGSEHSVSSSDRVARPAAAPHP